MITGLICIPLDHHGFHVVAQDFLRHALEEPEGITMTAFHRLIAHVIGELDIITQDGNEDVKREVPGTHSAPVDLHLMAGVGLKTDHRSGR